MTDYFWKRVSVTLLALLAAFYVAIHVVLDQRDAARKVLLAQAIEQLCKGEVPTTTGHPRTQEPRGPERIPAPQPGRTPTTIAERFVL